MVVNRLPLIYFTPVNNIFKFDISKLIVKMKLHFVIDIAHPYLID